MKELLRRTCFGIGGEIILNGGREEELSLSSGRADGSVDMMLFA
jgi:hypothetical protein